MSDGPDLPDPDLPILDHVTNVNVLISSMLVGWMSYEELLAEVRDNLPNGLSGAVAHYQHILDDPKLVDLHFHTRKCLDICERLSADMAEPS